MLVLRAVKQILGFTLGSLICFAAIEGTAASLLFFKRFSFNPVTPSVQLQSEAPSQYLQGDNLLGWVNRPGIYMENASGAGSWLKFNSQGFRNTEEISPKLASFQTRVLCSGDSFTFGFGVNNEETWCHLLGRSAGWQAVNLGMNGYGLDQFYLRYRREAQKLDHQVHVLAFIEHDIERIRSEVSFFGASKPFLSLENGQLVVRNYPIRDEWKPVPWIFTRGSEIGQLRAVEILSHFWPKSPPPLKMEEETAQEITRQIFQELKELSERTNRVFLAVMLPTGRELTDQAKLSWWDRQESVLSKQGVPHLNLVKAFQTIPTAELASYFIAGDGHYSPKGNAFVAEKIQTQVEHLLRSHTLRAVLPTNKRKS